MKKNTEKIKIALFSLFVIALFSCFSFVSAFQIENLPDISNNSDFVVGPGKTEIFLNPGESKIVELTITNRLNEERNFEVSVEDFTGSRNTEETVVLLGNEKGPYSLKDYLKPEKNEFSLSHGQRARLTVVVSAPDDAEPGGKYGSVLISAMPKTKDVSGNENVASGASVVTRIGTLFFVRINGEVKNDGILKKFSTIGEKRFFSSSPINFHLLFENNGSVHLNPYGIIEIKNIFGARVGEVKVDPWFVMPDSLRLREVKWDRNFLFGYYTAELKINRGYNDIIDEASAGFWVVPWKIVLAGVAGLFIVIFLLRWIISNFEIRKKS